MGGGGHAQSEPGPGHGPGNARVRRPAYVDAAAGALAGVVARFVVQPLDVLKIRFQVQVEPIGRGGAAAAAQSKYTGLRQALMSIVREEGVRGLWRGTLPGQLLTVPYTAVQFVALQQFKAAAARRGLLQGAQAPALSFVGGAFAGAAATVASYPFDLLRTTLAAQGEPRVYRGMLDAARGIVAAHGVAGLYRGLSITLLEIVPYAALQFGVYDALTAAVVAARRRRAAARGEEAAPRRQGRERMDRFLCGLAAGMVAKLGTHPLDVAKKRFQVAGLQRSLGYGARIPVNTRSLPAILAAIWAAEGARGLYKGVLPSIIKAAPSAAVTLSAYEFFLGHLAALAEPATA